MQSHNHMDTSSRLLAEARTYNRIWGTPGSEPYCTIIKFVTLLKYAGQGLAKRATSCLLVYDLTPLPARRQHCSLLPGVSSSQSSYYSYEVDACYVSGRTHDFGNCSREELYYTSSNNLF